MNSAGHTVTDDRLKSEGIVIAVSASAVWVNNSLRSIKELSFSQA